MRHLPLDQAAAVLGRPRLELQGGVSLFECYCREMSCVAAERIGDVAIYCSTERQQFLIDGGYVFKVGTFLFILLFKNVLCCFTEYRRSRDVSLGRMAAVLD
jgi:hypothetical protein